MQCPAPVRQDADGGMTFVLGFLFCPPPFQSCSVLCVAWLFTPRCGAASPVPGVPRTSHSFPSTHLQTCLRSRSLDALLGSLATSKPLCVATQVRDWWLLEVFRVYTGLLEITGPRNRKAQGRISGCEGRGVEIFWGAGLSLPSRCPL